ncbi:hypothetical protein F4604DRAFT_1936726 [Suillus subluteus]|nr:hypothetical protein F4604DRAFT_1936726 [Suillus subluteus]
MARAVSPERKKEYNRRYESKLPPDVKQKRRDAQAACKRKLRQRRSAARSLAEPNTSATAGVLLPAFSWTPSSAQHLKTNDSHSCTNNFSRHCVASSNDPRLRGLNLASGMLGTQVPLETKVVTWDDGHITILPTVICDGQNVLIEDLRLTKKFAAVPATKPGSRFVTHLNGALIENELLLMEIRSSLAAGKCVIVREAVKPGPLDLTMEYLEKRYGIHGTMPVDMHDMALRAKNPDHPHVPGVMSDLILGINNPNEQRCVLDCPIASPRRGPDGLAPDHQGLSIGRTGYTSWQPVGLGVPGRVTGIQLRTLLFHKITRDGKVPLQATKSLRGPHDLDDYDAETVTIYPGDLLIQPPGQLHAEYNPNPAFARGGHFFTYGTLHHTLSSRSLEVTAQTREYKDETLWRMAALIPRLPPDQLSGLHYWPLLALCFMVLKPRMYLAQRPSSKSRKKKQPVALRSPSYTRAYAVVTKILQHLDICPQDLPDILRGRTSVVEVGDVVDLGSCLLEFTHAS